jgi:hypothetical protein
MSALSTLVLLLASPQLSWDQLSAQMSEAIGSGNVGKVEALFVRKEDAAPLIKVAQNRGGFRNLKKFIAVIEGPQKSEYVAVFSARQDIEDHHDIVYSVATGPDGLHLGKDIPEWARQPRRIAHAQIDAQLFPEKSAVTVTAVLDMEAWEGSGDSLSFRLNLPYELSSVKADGKTVEIARPDGSGNGVVRRGQVMKSGGVIFANGLAGTKRFEFTYSGVITSPNEDKIDSRVAYITAKWVPSINRLPHTTSTRVTGPRDWVLVSEGRPSSEEQEGFAPVSLPAERRSVVFRCNLPISFPKIIAGAYKIAHEATDQGRTFRSYQLDPIDPERGKRDVGLMIESMKFFEKNLGPYPFPGYACFDADSYYGIESYSHTLLQRGITTRFVTHELGHTWFGGIVPNTYTRDTWNESFTQYVDSVLFAGNKDGTLQTGLRNMSVKVPLSQMDVAHDFGSATYFRGAYTLRMLENEIGLPNMIAAMKAIVADRIGKETVWADLRPYFERQAKQDLKWFWDQWIDRADFPSLEIKSTRLVQREGKWSTFVTVAQTGEKIMRLRFKINVRRYDQTWTSEVVLKGNQDTFRIDTDVAPTEASLDVFGYTLAKAGPKVDVRP